MLWVKELRLPAVLTAALSCFRLKRDSSQSHRLYLSHQAWRYGAEMLAQDEQGLVHWLGAICEWVEEELSK
jgi:hypothetical protein